MRTQRLVLLLALALVAPLWAAPSKNKVPDWLSSEFPLPLADIFRAGLEAVNQRVAGNSGSQCASETVRDGLGVTSKIQKFAVVPMPLPSS